MSARRARRAHAAAPLLAGLLAVAACTSGPVAAPSPAPTAAESGPTPTPTPTPTPLPDTPAELIVAVKGDWGAGTPAQAEVTARMCVVREQTPFTDVLTVGDNFYDPDGRATEGNYEEPEACLLAYPGHRWRATWGNHDAGGEDTVNVLGAQRWYRWRSGPAAFFALNSNHVGDDGQMRWFDEVLAAERAPVKVAYFHHSPYTVGHDHPPDRRIQERWVPLFERHDVTLVLTGHSHTYERHRRNGIDYVVTGGGGRMLDRCERIMTTLIRCAAQHHFTLLRIVPDRVVVHAIAASGETLDRFVVTP